MKKAYKYLGIIIITLFFSVTAITLYWHREQSINFNTIIPASFNYCGSKVDRHNAEYIQLYNWLKNNKNGWVNTQASYVSKDIFKSNTITIYILKYSVVINYTSNGNKYHQVTKAKQQNELVFQCKSS